MTVCAVKCCRNHSSKKDIINKSITFHAFPTDPVISSRWTEIIRRARNESWWKPKKRTCICSVHFHIKDTYKTKSGRRRIRSGAVPTKALYISSKMSDDDDESENSNEDVDDIHTNSEINSEELVEKNLDEPSTSTGQKTDESESTIKNEEEPALYIFSINSDDDDEPENPNEDGDDKVHSNLDINLEELIEKNFDEPSTSTGPKTDESESTIKNQEELEIRCDISDDLDSIYDSPTEAKLRKELRRKISLQIKHVKKIKHLQQTNRRLNKRNAALRQIISILKERRCSACLNMTDHDKHAFDK